MNLKELKEIIDIFESRESINELEIEKAGVRLRMKRSGETMASGPVLAPAPAVAALASAPLPSLESTAKTAAEGEGLVLIKSPIVGTFYKAPKPTAPPFVAVGDFVEKGTILCIIEAMKLMNEIESEVAGVVSAVLVENGQPVEYGEELFAIRPR
jgi:acetyl-CoA carboxylase biotin carboxyl carrier protein